MARVSQSYIYTYFRTRVGTGTCKAFSAHAFYSHLTWSLIRLGTVLY